MYYNNIINKYVVIYYNFNFDFDFDLFILFFIAICKYEA